VRLRRSALALVHATVSAALAGGCATAGSSPPARPALEVIAPGSPSPDTATGPATIHLRHLPAGIAIVGLDPDTRRLDVEVRIVGLVPGSSHAAGLLRGDCAQPGPAVHPLQVMVADAHGVADVRSRVDGVAETTIPTAGWQITVDAADATSAPLACGEVTNTADAAAVSVGLAPVDPPGRSGSEAAGTATLSTAGAGLTVVLDVTGLAPWSTHAADIRTGTCESEGPGVVHGLAALTADATGHAAATTRVTGVAAIPLGVWYVEVLRAGAGPGAVEPLVCGNVGP
jgi:hypothetical protein